MDVSFRFGLRQALLIIGIVFISVFVSGCQPEQPEFQGNDISDTNLGEDLAMVDYDGKLRTTSDYKGKVPVVFFGFTQCPDVCPTTLAQIAHAVELLEDDADDVQVIMI